MTDRVTEKVTEILLLLTHTDSVTPGLFFRKPAMLFPGNPGDEGQFLQGIGEAAAQAF